MKRGSIDYYGGNVISETRQYRASSDKRIIIKEQTSKKTRAECLIKHRPVPQTDTGGRVEDTKALERFTVKELGKLTP